jgi:hypothetical protein
MHAHTRLAVAMVVTLAIGISIAAQQNVTLVLRSGERVSGVLEDMGADFVMRVNNDERRYRTGDVAILDFAGDGRGLPNTELSKIPASGHLAIMRGGESFSGRLTDMTGRPLQLVFSTDSGERRVAADAIGRVYLARPDDVAVATTPTPQTHAGHRQVNVPANIQWTDTGINVRQGQRVAFSTAGRIHLSANPDDASGSAGSTLERRDRRAPIPSSLAGALIGRVGNDRPFGIGDQTAPLGMPGAGRLFLGINEADVRDNTGHFEVTVTQ